MFAYVQLVVRMLIAVFLVWKIVGEAGPWTACAVALCFLGIEGHIFTIRRVARSLKPKEGIHRYFDVS